MNALHRSVLVAGSAALALPSAALATNGPVLVNERGRTAASDEVHLVWHNRGAWRQTRGAMAGTPMAGHYHRDVDLGDGARCRLQISGTGFAIRERDRPRLRGSLLEVRRPASWGLQRFRVSEARGESKPQYVGRLTDAAGGPALTGVAVRRNPSYFRTAATALTVMRFDVTSVTERWRAVPEGEQPLEPTPEQREACAALHRAEAPRSIRNALTTSRVQRRS